jgi:hypothetical protein
MAREESWMATKIGDVFEVAGDGAVKAKWKVTIQGTGGSRGTVGVGTTINSASSIAGTTGQWIAANLAKPVPPEWTVE